MITDPDPAAGEQTRAVRGERHRCYVACVTLEGTHQLAGTRVFTPCADAACASKTVPAATPANRPNFMNTSSVGFDREQAYAARFRSKLADSIASSACDF
jgi:hypothetical protein